MNCVSKAFILYGVPSDHCTCRPSLAIMWDGTTKAVVNGSDNQQHFTYWVDGVTVGRVPFTGRQAAGYTTRDTYLMAGSDGLGGYSNMDMFDVMVGKNFTLTSQMVADYMRLGSVPSGIQHRWKLSGDTQDSIGTLHAFAGSALTLLRL